MGRSAEDDRKAEMGNHAEALLSALTESTEDPIWAVDLNYRNIFLNRALRESIAKDDSNWVELGMTAQGGLLPERAAFWSPLYDRALADGPFRAEHTLLDG